MENETIQILELFGGIGSTKKPANVKMGQNAFSATNARSPALKRRCIKI